MPKTIYTEEELQYTDKWFEEHGRPTENIAEKTMEAIRSRQPFLYKEWSFTKQNKDL